MDSSSSANVALAAAASRCARLLGCFGCRCCGLFLAIVLCRCLAVLRAVALFVKSRRRSELQRCRVLLAQHARVWLGCERVHWAHSLGED